MTVWVTRTAVAGALFLGPLYLTNYFTATVAIKALWMGIAAASLIFLASYVGMVSLAQTALFGIAGYSMAHLVVRQGWAMGPAVAAALVITVLVGLAFGAIAARSSGIYFLMITLAFAVIVYHFFGQVTEPFGGHEGLNDVFAPSFFGDPFQHPDRLYETTLVAALLVFVGIRYLVRTPFGLALQGVRDDPVRMSALGYNIALLRTLGFAVGALIAAVAGILSVWHETRISPGSIDLVRTINVLVIAIIGGLYRLEGAWIGAFIFVALDNYMRGVTERFETWIGALFLLIVLLSPRGIVGTAEEFFGFARRAFPSARVRNGASR